ncbi:MAG: hypothetical protein A2W99_06685 [Bacteroidetes bacterium GWF2_33_16]|nr:MAG: hypothetical protein A2X00_12120 [Bacteroidetes bacterium GWE2_32_14]OFY04381.1 MAG: hypothetical protein A2W99_06685 [Bacteroidetes bacterium GWF2_33_16]
MQKLFLSICLTCFNFFLYSQNITISGYVIDESTGEYLIGANIYDSNNQKGYITNKFGFYSIVLNKGKQYTFDFSFVGYSSSSIIITSNKDTSLNIRLIAGTNLQEVKVTASRKSKLEERKEISKIEIPLEQIKTLPTITGEPDILKAYQLMTGVQGGNEGTSGLYVRGGTPDQNLFLLDDVPIYNASHLGGIYSVFNSSMVKSIDFYKGGFPSRYGERTSSVIDIRTKDGNLNELKGEVGFSLLLSKIFIESPIVKDKCSFAFAIRRSNLDLYSYAYQWLINNPYYMGYTFYDLNLKINYILGKKDRLFVSFYNGKDKSFYKERENQNSELNYNYKAESNIEWGNTSGSFRWYHVFGGKIFNNLTFAYTKYQYLNENYSERINKAENSKHKDFYNINSEVKDLILKSDFEVPFVNNSLKLGFKYSNHSYIPCQINYSDNLYFVNVDTSSSQLKPNNKLNANDFSAYLEYHFNYKKLSGNVGFRSTYFTVESKNFNSFEPRIILNYLLLKSLSVKTSYCQMQQYVHLLTNSNTGLPTDLWIPSTDKIAPETSKQITLGLAHTTKKDYEISIEAYYKELNNLIEYKEGVLIFNASKNWNEKIETKGTGKVKGLEFLFQKKQGALNGWIAYTLSKNERSFKNIDNGESFPFKYDQRHNFSIVANWEISKKLTLSGTWIYNTENNITLPSGKYQLSIYDHYYEEIILTDVHIYDSRNSYKMPSYHRLDIGFNYTKHKLNGIAKWTFGIYNVYNRQNPYYLYFKAVDGETKLYQQSLLPIFINFGYSFIF